MDPQIGQVSGIPAVFVRSAGPFVGGLMFRVGTADEPVTWRGASRAVERLALRGLDQTQSAVEGTTTPLMTMFCASGDPATVAGNLERVAANLCSLRPEDVDEELRILRAEAERTDAGLAGDHLSARFGNSGLGAVGLREFGLEWLGANEIQTWAATHFNRDNACWFFAGTVVPPCEVHLPAGRRLITPAPSPRQGATQHAWLAGSGDTVAVSWLSTHGPETIIVSDVIDKIANAKLREEDTLSYDVRGLYERIGVHKGQSMIVADSFPNEAAQLQEAMIALLSQIGLAGCPQPDIDAVVASHLSMQTDSRSGRGRAIGAALDLLVGSPTMTDAEQASHFNAVTPRLVALQIEQAWDELVWTLGAEPLDRRMVEYDVVHQHEVVGEVFPIDISRLDPDTVDADRLPAAHVTIGSEGVSRNWNGRIVRVGWDTVEAIVRTAEGTRTLLGRDGAVLSFEPSVWTNGTRLIERIDNEGPLNKVVQLQH